MSNLNAATAGAHHWYCNVPVLANLLGCSQATDGAVDDGGSVAPEPTPAPTIAPTAPARPLPSPPLPTHITLGQLNTKNLFDVVDDARVADPVATPAEYDLHLRKLALTLRDAMGAPDVVTLQEVENERVLRDLAARPELAALGYEPIIREGRDPRGIDVAMLYRRDHVHPAQIAVWDVDGTAASGRRTKAFTRPPLAVTFAAGPAADAAAGAREVTVVAAHLTSQLQGDNGIRRRSQQLAAIAQGVDGARAARPGAAVVVAGDLNLTATDPAFSELVGTADATHGARLLTPLDSIAAADRYSYRRGRSRQLLDHVLVTPNAGATVTSARIPHVNTEAARGEALHSDTPNGASDHDPVVVGLDLAPALTR